MRSDGGNDEQVHEEKRDAEMEHKIKQKEDSEDQEGDTEKEQFTDDEAPAPESGVDTNGRFGLSLLRVHTPSSNWFDQKPSSSSSTRYQAKAKLGWSLDDARKKMLMNAGIGIANPICRCPCHGGDSHDHAVQQCHCMSKGAFARKYWEENSVF
jgi:hypothetical protein